MQALAFLVALQISINPLGATTLQTSESETAESAVENPSEKSGSGSADADKVVDLSHAVAFEVTLDASRKTQVAFKGLDGKSIPLPNSNPEAVNQILLKEIGNDAEITGVVIRVDRNVGYESVSGLFSTVRKTLDQEKLSTPVYINVQDPAPVQDKDDIATREFVFKNKKAADYYDRVANISKFLKISIRLDPARNSITAKGPSSKLVAIGNLIHYIDGQNTNPVPEETEALPPKNTNPTKNTDPTKPPEKPPAKSADSSSTNASDKATLPPNKNPARNLDPGSAPRTQSGQNSSPNGATAAMPVGRYQMSVLGNNLFMLDTATGESWFLDATQRNMTWIKLPHPSSR